LARPPGLPRPPPGLRRLRGGPLVPVLRHRPDRPGGGAGAGEAGTVLLTSAPPAGAAPPWLRTLALNPPRRTVPPPPRPPAHGTGRPSAGVMLFGETGGEPDLLMVQRSPWLRRHAGQPAFPGGAIEAADHGPVGAALREAAEEAGVDPAGVEVLAVLPELYIARSGFSVTPVLAWGGPPGAGGAAVGGGGVAAGGGGAPPPRGAPEPAPA